MYKREIKLVFPYKIHFFAQMPRNGRNLAEVTSAVIVFLERLEILLII